jgi:hypothetical protein
MKNNAAARTMGILLCGMVLGGLIVSLWKFPPLTTHAAQTQTQTADPTQALTAMQADIAHLKEVVPSQSHSMADVAYHFTNLWFAGEKSNWPLATFNLNEARQHIRWTIRIRPVRQLNGNPVDLAPIWDSIDNGVMGTLKKAIEEKDHAKFESAYKQALNGCYGCHQAAGLTFLKPGIPTAPAQTIVSFDPLPSE